MRRRITGAGIGVAVSAARRRCLAIAAVAALGLIPASQAAGATVESVARTTPPYWLLRGPGVTAFGAFAGYVWRGDERSIGASWTVPRVTPSTQPSPALALAATWIGAQTSGPGRPPFIQVGINEVRTPFGNVYFAFYSDTKLSFHAHSLFRVRAGDAITAGMRLAGGRWHVLIVDHTHHHKAAFATTDDADAVFTQAEWLQEDPRYGDGRLVPYPQLSTVSFRRLRVNSGSPQYAKLRSQWMSENGEDLAPSPLVNDGFSFAPTEPTPIGMHYLQIQVTLDIALGSFEKRVARWEPRTPSGAVASQRSALAAALRADVQAIAGSQWPVGVQPLCNRLVALTKLELAQVETPVTHTQAGIRHWVLSWLQIDRRITVVSLRVRRLLGLPQLFPLPRVP